MDERMRFVIRLQEGESMAFLCREFGISRKTGYKILDRYKERESEFTLAMMLFPTSGS